MTQTAFENGILRRLLDSADERLTPEVARFFLGLEWTDADHERIAELSEKANEGTLSNDEREDLSMYVLLIDLVAIMKSKASASQKSQTPAA